MTNAEPMPARLFLSSGDLVADRRFDFARDLRLKGDLIAAADLLVPGGLLAFTVETHGGEGVILGGGLRYAHGAGYVRMSIADAGLILSRLEDLSARNEDNAPVPGLVVVAAKA
jgi:predicted TPR repeat methyltransferase